jgi:mannose/fructose/N-acetylgalactosamine-specific phosphotransferase system component IIC
LLGWGSAPGDISIDVVAFTVISTNLVVSYDEEGVVLPRG